MNPLFTIVLAFILAVAAEGGIEALFGTIFKKLTALQSWKEVVLLYIGLGTGVFLTWYYNVDMIASLAALSGNGSLPPSIVGNVLSGLVVGRGSAAVHDFFMTIYNNKKLAEVKTEVIKAGQAPIIT